MKKIFLVSSILLIFFTFNCGKKEEPKTEEAAPVATLDPETAKGKEQYDINCSSCHGSLGAGDGIAAASLNPKPRNYKAPAAEWKNGNTEVAILKTLNEGIKGSPMVAYKHLGDENLKNIAKYVVYLTKN